MSLPYLRGPKPFAIVLLQFKDTVIPDVPMSKFFNFVTSSGNGGLFEYWHDMSNGTISLENSEVFGWFTMQYSFLKDGADPLHNSNTTTPARQAWVAEAKRLCGQQGIDLSRFYGGTIVIINANCDEGNVTRGWPGRPFGETVLSIGGSWGQSQWRRCHKCQSLTFGDPERGSCAGGGVHQYAGSRSYALAMNLTTYPGIENHRWCSKCQVLYWAGLNTPIAQGTCPAGGFHDPTLSSNYRVGDTRVGGAKGWEEGWKLCNNCCQLFYSRETGICPEGGGSHDSSDTKIYGIVSYFSSMNLALQAYESGRCLGLSNSWLSGVPDVELGDKFDTMSNLETNKFNDTAFPPAGPSLNAATRFKLGWIPTDRVWYQTSPSTGSVKVKLLALNKSQLKGNLMIHYTTPHRLYIIEYRLRQDWDQGLSQDCVLIHELRSKYAVGQKGFRWCNKCQGLFSAKTAVCPAGLLHDHTGSGNYRLENNNINHNGQKGWATCTECRIVWYTSNPEKGSCPARPGQSHQATQGENFSLAFEPAVAPGQHGWKWCRKCQGISYSQNSSQGACPQGGLHEHSNSGNYILNDTGAGTGSSGFRWCRLCQGLYNATFNLCMYAGSHEYDGSGDYALAVNDSSAPGQEGWKVCGKCHGLHYAPSQGRCAIGGEHDRSDSAVFTVPSNNDDQTGQDNWRRCTKCQLLYFPEFMNTISCPASGGHTADTSLSYKIPHFETDRVFLVGNELHVGDTWKNEAGIVSVKVGDADAQTSSVTIFLN